MIEIVQARARAAGFRLRSTNGGNRLVCSKAGCGSKARIPSEDGNARQRSELSGDEIRCPYVIVVPIGDDERPLHRGKNPQRHASNCPWKDPDTIRDTRDPQVIEAALADPSQAPATVVANLLKANKNIMITTKDIVNIRRRQRIGRSQVRTDIPNLMTAAHT